MELITGFFNEATVYSFVPGMGPNKNTLKPESINTGKYKLLKFCHTFVEIKALQEIAF